MSLNGDEEKKILLSKEIIKQKFTQKGEVCIGKVSRKRNERHS